MTLEELVSRLRDYRERFLFQGGSTFATELADLIEALDEEAATWEERARHLGWRDERKE